MPTYWVTIQLTFFETFNTIFITLLRNKSSGSSHAGNWTVLQDKPWECYIFNLFNNKCQLQNPFENSTNDHLIILFLCNVLNIIAIPFSNIVNSWRWSNMALLFRLPRCSVALAMEFMRRCILHSNDNLTVGSQIWSSITSDNYEYCIIWWYIISIDTNSNQRIIWILGVYRWNLLYNLFL